jgi:hypothetical protein
MTSRRDVVEGVLPFELEQGISRKAFEIVVDGAAPCTDV